MVTKESLLLSGCLAPGASSGRLLMSPAKSFQLSFMRGGTRFSSSWRRVRSKMQTTREENCKTVVIVPGWLSESSQYEDLASYLRSKGFKTQIVQLKWYNWIPSLGGRSVRPILDRIYKTVASASYMSEEQVESEDWDMQYTFSDFLKEFINPKNGAQPPRYFSVIKNDDLSVIPPLKVILLAHSAGGWICRILLGGKVPYDGRIYAASENVKALITLGTPHLCTDKLTKRNMEFVNTYYPGASEASRGVDYVCIAGKFVQGETRFGGLWKDFAWQSYELCCGDGGVWGDGVIPLDCAIALEGARHVILEGVEHFPSVGEKKDRQWYGSPEVVHQWYPFLEEIASQATQHKSSDEFL